MLSRQEALRVAIEMSAFEARSSSDYLEEKKITELQQKKKATYLAKLLKQFFASAEYEECCKLVSNHEAKERSSHAAGYGYVKPEPVMVDLSRYFGWNPAEEGSLYAHFYILRQEVVFGRSGEAPPLIAEDVNSLTMKLVDCWQGQKKTAEEILTDFRNMFGNRIEDLVEQYVPREVGEVYKPQETENSKNWMPVIVVLLLLIGAGIYFWP